MIAGLAMVAGYLVGSFPTSYLVGRTRGLDLRRVGSGNLGASNVYRTLGLLPALLVAVVDIAKGFLPVLLAQGLSPWVRLGVGLAAIFGHVWSPWVGFHGGKGVATGIGVYFGLAPFAALWGVGLWALVVGLTRTASIGSLSAALGLPVILLLLGQGPRSAHQPVFIFSLVTAAFIVFTHRQNIRRLIRGEELRIGKRKAPASRGQIA